VTDGVLDSHHHLWDTRELDYPLFRGLSALERPFLAADYDAEAGGLGITASILVEAASAGADGRLETPWLKAEAARSALVAGIVAWAPLDEPDAIEAHLDWLLSLDGAPIVGVRRSFELEGPDFPRRPEIAAGVRAAAERGLVVDVVLYSPSLAAAIDLVDAAPQAQFVLDHVGKPRIRERVRSPWEAELAELALRPKVVCKLSGLATEADREGWTVADVEPYAAHALECFGADRMLYGSDWPVVELAGGHARWLAAVEQLLAGADEVTKAAIFAGNARRVYGLS
jgi:L-fuconolactonase